MKAAQPRSPEPRAPETSSEKKGVCLSLAEHPHPLVRMCWRGQDGLDLRRAGLSSENPSQAP